MESSLGAALVEDMFQAVGLQRNTSEILHHLRFGLLFLYRNIMNGTMNSHLFISMFHLKGEKIRSYSQNLYAINCDLRNDHELGERW